MPRNIRKIYIQDNIGIVQLTKGHVALIDANDAELVGQHNWCAVVRSHTVYAATAVKNGEKQRTLLLHRFLSGEPNGIEVDHKSGNGLDNRRCNLRLATHSQNMHNRRINSNNKSGYKGVYWSKRQCKWVASICINGKQKHIGSFETPEQAHTAYCEQSERLHKEFGRT